MTRSRGVRARKARACKIGPAPCRYGSNCWRAGCVFNDGDCPERTAQVSALAGFWRSQSVRESTDQRSQVRRDTSQLRGAVCKLAAKIMWNSAISHTTYPVHRQSGGHSVVDYAVENPTVSEQVVVSKIPEVPAMQRVQEQIVESIMEIPQERVQQRTVDQIVRVPVPTVQERRFVPEIPRAQVVKRILGNIVETIPQERARQRTVEQNVCMSVPTVQEQMNVQEIPGAQVVERIQKQVAETTPQERVQRTVEQNVCMSVPTVQEQIFVPKKPGSQGVERIPEHIVESFDQEELDQLRQDWLMGAFELQNGEDGRRERKSSKKKVVNRTRLKHPDL